MTGSPDVDEAAQVLDELRAAIRDVLDARGDDFTVKIKAGKAADAEDALWREAASLGWFGLNTAETHGGLGLGMAAVAVLYVELGRSVAPLHALPSLLAAEALALGGTAAQKERWLARLASGESRAAIALPVAGQVRPAVDGNGQLSGTAPHMLGARRADLNLIPVDLASGGVGFALVERGDPGVSISGGTAIDLTRDLCALDLRDVACGEAQTIRLASGQWNRLLDHASLAVACDAVGGAGRILELTAAYLALRTQFGRPIGSFQALKHRTATSKVLLESVTALAQSAVAAYASQDAESSALASGAKVAACDAYVAIAGDAIQLHGGIGFTWDHYCHLYMKRARLDAVLFGTATQHRERVAELAFPAALRSQGAPPSVLAL